MNNFLNRFFILLIIVCCMATANAQTDVKVLDLSVLPFSANINQTQTDSVELSVRFKINKAAKASKVQFWLGSAVDQSNVFVATPTFSTSGNTTSINYQGKNKTIQGYETEFKIKISKQQYSAYTTATLFVETTDGQPTTRLYYYKK